MCGIAGFISGPVEPFQTSWLPAGWGQSLKHRGPDSHGFWALDAQGGQRLEEAPEAAWAGGIVGLAHWRLSILDLSSAGAQPMCRHQRHWVAYNGEITNFIEIRRELEAAGDAFSSSTDTEVLLAAWRHWGPDCLGRFEGMFAFALVDLDEGLIHLARDPFGIKPLYVANWQHGLAFASEFQALSGLPGVDLTLHPQNWFDYLRFGKSEHLGASNWVLGIRELPPGHWLTVDFRADKPTWGPEQPYWPKGRKVAPWAGGDWRADAFELLTSTVSRHMRSDVPVGAGLSGGLDSSSVVACMRHVEPDADIHVFTFVPDFPGTSSEEPYARAVAMATRARHHIVRVDAAQLPDLMADTFNAQQLPHPGPSVMAQQAVFQAAKAQGIKVMLDGQGGDEVFAGYNWIISAYIAELLNAGKWAQAVKVAQKAAASARLSTVQVLSRGLGMLFPKASPVGRRLLGKGFFPAWMDPQYFRRHQTQASDGLHLEHSASALKDILLESQTCITLPRLFRYSDRNAMANAIEVRVPLATTMLSEFVRALPSQDIVGNTGLGKHVLRTIMDPHLPLQVTQRSDKVGFDAPDQAWLVALGPWLRRQEKEGLFEHVPGVQTGVIRRWIDQIESQQQAPNAKEFWRIITAAEWLHRHHIRVG